MRPHPERVGIGTVAAGAAQTRRRARSSCRRFGAAIHFVGWAVACWAVAGGCVFGQQADGAAEPASPAGQIEIHTSSRLRHVPGSWSYLDVLATNRGDTEGEALVVVSFPTADGRQYARRVWLPARGERTTWLPVRIPTEIPAGRTTMPMTVMTLDARAAGDQLSRADEGTGFVQEDLLRISDDAVRSATYLDRQVLDDAEWVGAASAEYTTTLAVARTAVQLSTSFADLADDLMPPWPTVFRGLDQILLASDRILTDTGGVAALRGWVRDGGRLWVALDAIRPETAAAILGDDRRLEVIDRVQLDRYTIDADDADGVGRSEDACELDRPVDFVRVVTSHPGVVARIGGWPAAIQIPYGNGEVVITTLGPRGWLAADGTATQALKLIAARLLTVRSGRLDPSRLQAALETRIGATVPPRWLAGTVLGAFSLALVSAALLLGFRGRLAGLGIAVPALALLATLALVAIGRAGSRGLPAQIATAEVVRLAPRTGETLTDGVAAVYDTVTRDVAWSGDGRQWAIPRPQPGTPPGRLLFGDDDRVVAGGMPTHSRSIDRVALAGIGATRGAVARGRFGPEGLEGRLAVADFPPAADGADPFIVAWPSAALAVTLAEDGGFSAPASAIMAADQYASAAVLSAESIWRQEVVRTLLAIPGGAMEDGDRPVARISPDAEPPPLQGRPWLAYWTRPETDGFGLASSFDLRRAADSDLRRATDSDFRRAADPDFRRAADSDFRRAALVVAELAIDRTPPGSRFRIPATFLRPQPVSGEMGRSAAFDPRTGRWIRGLTRPTETLLRFQLPSEVLPCRLDAARIEVRATAPGRVLTIAPFAAGQAADPTAIADPAGVSVIEIPGSTLQPDSRGGLTFRIAIGQADRPTGQGADDDDSELTDTWQIDHVRLTVDGTTE
jgi:hypothetical protein